MFFDVCEASKAQEVMRDTWGHLAPQKGQSYKGYMIYAHSGYDDIVLIDSGFKNLSDSPWLYGNMQDFIAENGERGNIYRWDGYYKVFTDNRYCFDGIIKKIIT